GGVAAAKYLINNGAALTITDAAAEEQLTKSLDELGDYLDVVQELSLGRHREEDFREAKLLVVNPAVLPDNEWVQYSRRNHVPVTTELGLCWNELRFVGAKISAVTGSNGKSTTAALLHSLLDTYFARAWLGGNLGGSLLPDVDRIRVSDWAVLEVSSFQSHYLDSVEPGPHVAIVTNFSPNHLDWHCTLEHYRASKQLLLDRQDWTGIAVLNADDPPSRDWPVKGEKRLFGLTSDDQLLVNGERIDWPVLEWTGLKGRHHLANIAAAMTAAQAIGVPLEAMEAGLRKYTPLPHRLQRVGELAGREFYNDSLATTPESAIAALHAFDQPIILLAGGYDKGSDLEPFAHAMSNRCKQVVLMGVTGEKLARHLDAMPHRTAEYTVADDFKHALDLAWSGSEPGDVILLSPGCASYGWFRDFRERGERFTQEFQRLCGEQAT
ncbi:MAG: UDP-N-acetylmuramoyl-L-alanine--D-glutamate ligase, partial [Planctomyces sp.]|nr:UDP-N-acetylmuramoyl-L-alanine--D-glutamate ligase [Planctomyces sp.]